MHTYLESIGFGRITRARQIEKLMRESIMHFDRRYLYNNEYGILTGEFTKYYGENLGITVCGEFDEGGSYHPEYMFPLLDANTVSMSQIVEFEKHTARESYGGICEDPRIGTSLIFHLSNLGEYMTQANRNTEEPEAMPIRLAALAKKGTIVLPVYKTVGDEEAVLRAREEYLRLVTEAREGDEEAIEALTADDMNNYNILSKRLLKEDILSIVDTYFQPYGIECDIYNICGNVLSCEKTENQYTGEKIWKMQLEACDVYFDLCINETHLEGEPMKGSRFRGVVWLQGNVQFLKEL